MFIAAMGWHYFFLGGKIAVPDGGRVPDCSRVMGWGNQSMGMALTEPSFLTLTLLGRPL